MFWTLFVTYNPITKGVVGLIILKRIILLLLSAGSCISIFSSYAEKSTDKIILPYSIEGTQLVLERIGADIYSGITEAVFYNSGHELLESFYVEVFTDRGMYYFETTMLPAGERILLRERDGKKWDALQIIGGHGYFKLGQNRKATDITQELIVIQDQKLIIDNSQNKAVKILDIYLKPWDMDTQMYGFYKTHKISVRNMNINDVLTIDLPASDYRVVYYEFVY